VSCSEWLVMLRQHLYNTPHYVSRYMWRVLIRAMVVQDMAGTFRGVPSPTVPRSFCNRQEANKAMLWLPAWRNAPRPSTAGAMGSLPCNCSRVSVSSSWQTMRVLLTSCRSQTSGVPGACGAQQTFMQTGYVIFLSFLMATYDRHCAHSALLAQML
jgi:hypothetical protein